MNQGNQFEYNFCDLLAQNGFWAKRLDPSSAGEQPFDIIAGKDGKIYAFECKVCNGSRFTLNRVEDNQQIAMKKFMACGNIDAWFAFWYVGYGIYLTHASDIFWDLEQGVKSHTPLERGNSIDYWMQNICGKEHKDC